MVDSLKQPDFDTIVVGGGWSGLTAAYYLSKTQKVAVFEAAPQLGGRARNIDWQGITVDNGQHLLLGAYQHTLALMNELSLSESDYFHRLPLQWIVHGEQPVSICSQSINHWLPTKISGISVIERLKLLKTLICLRRAKHTCGTAATWLSHYSSHLLRKTFWEPLCLAALTTPSHLADFQVFRQVCLEAFASPSNSNMLIAKKALGDFLPKPLAGAIKDNGSSIMIGQRVKAVQTDGQIATGVIVDNALVSAKNIILATPLAQTAKLLSEHPSCNNLTHDLSQIPDAMISTLYLQFDQSIELQKAMQYIDSSIGFWGFDRRYCGQPGLLAIVFSESHPLLSDETSLTEQVLEAIAFLLPNKHARPSATKLIKEKRGAFIASPHTQTLRPKAQTPINNLLLAGDYVYNKYPACLEGAVMNGAAIPPCLL